MSKVKISVMAIIAVAAVGTGAWMYSSFATAAPVAATGPQSVTIAASTNASTGDPYPLTTCPVSKAELGSMGDPIILDHNGREIRLCCKGCIGKFEADPDSYLKAVNAQIVAQQSDYYPLDTCLVSGEELGSMGKVINYVYNNRLVRLCCGGCINKLKNDPATYIGKLDAAVVQAQSTDYPLDTCLVAGGKLGSMGDPIDYVFANQLVRFCCKGCIKKFDADPLKYMAQLK